MLTIHGVPISVHTRKVILTAMGIDSDLAHASLRLTVGAATTSADIDHVLTTLPAIITRLRALAGSH